MAGRGDDGAVEVDVDVVPMMESPRHLFVSLAIRVGQVVLGGVGEDDAEPERGIEGVPLDHRDVVGGIGLLHLDREVEPGRPATQHDDLHGDRKSTRLNSSHGYISYAVFCLKKKKKNG